MPRAPSRSCYAARVSRKPPALLRTPALAIPAVSSSLASSLVCALLAGCSNSTDSGTIQIITDDDAGTFTQAPSVTQLSVLAETADASATLATAQLPTSTIDLGTLQETSDVVSIAIQGVDATNVKRVFGQSLPIEYAGLAGLTVPIFVQRDGQMARLPGPLGDSRSSPLLSVVQGEYLLVTGGSDPSLAASTQLYDFGFFAPLASPPALPVTPRSLAFAGTVAWLIGDTTAEYFDFSSSVTASLTLPSGGTPADIAGGATIVDPSGAQYIVGATRATGVATAKVLKVDPNDTSNTAYPYGNTTWITLSAPRAGAAATWSTGAGGLVVTGGSDTAAGVEVVSSGTLTGVPLSQFPPDPTSGAGVAQLDTTHLVVAGGFTGLFQDPGVRSLDLSCSSTSASCATVTSWGPLPVVLGSAQVFTFGLPDDALIVGNEIGSQATHVYRLSPSGAGGAGGADGGDGSDGGTTPGVTELPTRVPHVGAAAAWSPVGSVVLFGGANAVESFVE
jgi:hypothetical protein